MPVNQGFFEIINHFYRKLNRKGADFTIKEVDAISKELNLTWDEVVSIFFSASLSRK